MLEINLLPPERRPVERTPLPRLATIFIGVALVSAEVFFSLILFFYRIPQTKLDLDAKKQSLKLKQEEAKRADELEKRIAEIEERVKVIDGLRLQRVAWTPVFDHLDEKSVIPDEVWLVSFDITPSTDKPGTGKISGYARGPSPTVTIGKFIANMQTNPEIGKAFPKIEFLGSKETPLKSARTSVAGAQALPPVASAFDISLELAPLPKIEQPKPAGAAARKRTSTAK